jgi:hypothetical protein
MDLPGNQLETLCAQAQNEVVLVAPFIKVQAFARLLSQISDEAEVRCVTRWRPEEIIAGISDIEVWTLLIDRPHTSLWLQPDLHAKYYRADQQCLIGSANITATALGWHTPANLELLVPLSSDYGHLSAFETELFAGAIQVNQALFEQMQKTVQLFKEQYPDNQPGEPCELISEEPDAGTSDLAIAHETWLPSLRNPEDLYLAYCGRAEDLTLASREAAFLDLQALSVPTNLSRQAFQAYIGLLLLQKPIIHQVDSFLETPQRFGAVAGLLSSLPCRQNSDFDADRAWQTLMRWLRYYLPERYTLSVPRHSEVFSKAKDSNR